MSLKFAANLNFLFAEEATSLMQKMRRARQAGFRAVEIPYPGSDVIDEVHLAQKETGLQVALMNIALDNDSLPYGSASISGAEETFKKQLDETIASAKLINCKKIHIMAGLQQANISYDDHLKTYTQNLSYASERLQSEGIVGVIEPINKYALPEYFMNNYDTAIDIIKKINSPNLKLMLDLFHLQHICGNVTNTFRMFNKFIGHIQIAQTPHRHEPDVAGELDFAYVFKLIQDSGYTDWIGCEYKPATTTVEGLKWLQKYELRL